MGDGFQSHAESKFFSGKLVVATRVHIVLILILSLVAPVATAYVSYRQSLSDINNHFTENALHVEQNFARRAEVETMNKNINEINTRLSNIEGYLKALSSK